ncbi:hypothetical protein [Actinomadura sp. 6N118]|uniref:hypothetical protein n=1 Tax=Actinomadura sp. 6N118 TaxID=3375151 RepID=UPI0037A1648D
MAHQDSFLDSFTAWAVESGHGGSVDAVRVLSALADDHLARGLAELTPDDLEELLLEACPRELVIIEPDEELPAVSAAVADVISFLGATGRIGDEDAGRLRTALDRVRPRLEMTVMNPQLWSSSKSVLQTAAAGRHEVGAVQRREVADLDRYSDEIAVAFGGRRVAIVPASGPEEVAPPIPPVRMAPLAELADAVRAAPLAATLIGMLDWIGVSEGITEHDVLPPRAALELVAHLGLAEPPPGELVDAAKLPELHRLWVIALDSGLLEIDDDERAVHCGDLVLEDGDDADTLESWEEVILSLIDPELPVPERDRPALEASRSLLLLLFNRREPTTPGEAEEQLRDRGLTAGTRAIEHAAEMLGLAGLVERAGSALVLTPLGLWAGRVLLQRVAQFPVPILGSLSGVDAATLIYGMRAYDEAERQEELSGWLNGRSADDAAKEIAQALGEASPLARAVGVTMLIDDLGPAGRAALASLEGDPRIAGVASLRLADRGEQTEFMPGHADGAWVLADMAAAGIELGGHPGTLLPAFAHDTDPAEAADLVTAVSYADHPWRERIMSALIDHPAPAVVRAVQAAHRRRQGLSEERPGARGRTPKKPKKKGKNAGSRKKRR